jgi:sterol desaturase/sphingolipid hydroxylase (fatty acid hydroxylase superfamily)
MISNEEIGILFLRNLNMLIVPLIWFNFAIFLLDYVLSKTKNKNVKSFSYTRNQLLGILFNFPLMIQKTMLNTLLYSFLFTISTLRPFGGDEITNMILFFGFYVLYDFCYWVIHLLSHKVNFFWKGHSVHHMSEQFNFIVAFKIGFTEQFNFFPVSILFSLLGVPFPVYLTIIAIQRSFMGWVHSNVKTPKFLDYILITPSLHREHHKLGVKSGNCNFGGTFTCWDLIFKSFTPENSEYKKFGVTGVIENHPRPIRHSLSYFFDVKKIPISDFNLSNKYLIVAMTIIWISSIGYYILKNNFKLSYYFIVAPWVVSFLIDFEVYKKPRGRFYLIGILILLIIVSLKSLNLDIIYSISYEYTLFITFLYLIGIYKVTFESERSLA